MRLKTKCWIILILLLNLPLYTSGTEVGQLVFEQLDVEKLPNNAVTKLAQDHTGFVWIGTQNGLLRFDGYDYQTAFTQPSPQLEHLATSYIRSLLVDQHNRVWIGTMNDGLFVYDIPSDQLSHFKHQPSDPNSLADNRVEAVVDDGQGGVWLGTYGGLDHFYPDDNRFEHYTHDDTNSTSLNHDRIRTLLIDSQSNLWIGTWLGLDKLAPNSNTFEHIDSGLQPGLTGQQVFRLFEDSSKQIWIGTYEHGVTVYQPQTGLFQRPGPMSHSLTTAFIQSAENQVWVGSFGGGIDVLDTQSLKIVRKIKANQRLDSALGDNSIGSLMVDSGGIVWVGTWGYGINRYNANNRAFQVLRHSDSGHRELGLLTHPDTFSVLATDDQVWVGTRGKGVNVLDSALTRRIELPALAPLDDKQIKSLYQSDDGHIWIGTISNGLYRFSPTNNNLKRYTVDNGLPNNLIEVITSTNDGNLWLGTDDGLVRLAIQSDELTVYKHQKDEPHSLSANVIETLVFDQKQTLWVGSHDGLNAFDINSGKNVRIVRDPGQPDSLSHNHVNSLLVDRNGRLWVASPKGIDIMTEWDGQRASFQSVNKMTGQPPGWRENLMEDNFGRIWSLADSNSLLMISLNPMRISTFERHDGVNFGNSWTGTFATSPQGLLFYGGTEGVLRVSPQLAATTDFVAPIVLTKLQINGQNRAISQLNEGLILQPQDKQFAVEFAQLNYLMPEKVRYQYRLLGFSQQWTTTDAGHRQINYTNLAPDEYQLQVRSIGIDGKPQDNMQQRRINVLPTFWQTWQFKVIILITLALLAYLLLRWRTHKLNQQALFLRNLVSKRTSELETLAHISKELNATLDIESISQRLHKHVSSSLDAHVFALAIIDADSNQLQFSNVIENTEQLPSFSIELTNHNHLAVICVKQRQTVLLNKRSDAIKYIGELSQPMAGSKMASVLYQPLTAHDGKIIGCITVQSLKPNAYNPSNVELLGTLASYTAIALENARAYQALESLSNTDYLTRLPNRRSFFDTAATLMAHSKRNLSHFALALADIDHFKSFNDRYGHDAGDEVLKSVSSLMKQCIREQDTVARWGGEEFIFLLPDTQLDGANVLADKIRQAIETASFSYEDQHFDVTMTFGVTVFKPGEDLMACIHRADGLLYQGKEAGRNRVEGG